MIKYKLKCKDCNISFDSWFASSKEYERLEKNKYINCHSCNSFNIKKTLMSPNVLRLMTNKSENFKDEKTFQIKKKIKEYQKFIKNNFEYVGKNFAHEARLIHFDNKKCNKGIYGNVTKAEITELNEEGIKTEIVPWTNENNN